MNAFLETFFKPNLIAQYLPSILKGVVTTIEIALAVVITGLALGLVLAVIRSFQIKPLNALIVILRRHVPRTAAAGHRADCLFWPAEYRH